MCKEDKFKQVEFNHQTADKKLTELYEEFEKYEHLASMKEVYMLFQICTQQQLVNTELMKIVKEHEMYLKGK